MQRESASPPAGIPGEVSVGREWLLIFGVVAVAVGALGRGVFVENDRLAGNDMRLGMAAVAFQVGVAAGEGEMGARVVIEGGRHPALGIVAVAAMGFGIPGDKLRIVDVGVAGFTGVRSAGKARGGGGRGLVTFGAGDRAMGAEEREFRFGVIEAVDVGPGLGSVASFAAEGGAVGAFASHAVLEFALMGIGVAGGTRAIVETEGYRRAGGGDFMAIGAGHGGVSAGEREAGLAMLGDGESGAVEIGDGVAGFAAIVPGSGGELVVVRILVAIGAGFEFHFIDGVLAGRNMALGAIHLGVLALEGIGGSVMQFDGEERGLPAFNVVALGTFALLSARGELALVRIRLVAIGTMRVDERLLEVTIEVAGRAGDLGVLAEQRIVGFGVVEVEAGLKVLPA